MSKIIAKKYDFETVKGITMNQLNQHYTLYKGYVNRLNEIWSTTNLASKFNPGNTTYSQMRCLKLGETYALDGVRLHELYFENMTCNHNAPYGKILKLIKRDFYSLENFFAYFKNVGASMRGWATLVIDPLDNKLHVIGSDFHDTNVPWVSTPLLVMDVYEHAYMIDFGIDRAKYMDIFLKNINWSVVNKRLEKYLFTQLSNKYDNIIDMYSDMNINNYMSNLNPSNTRGFAPYNHWIYY